MKASSHHLNDEQQKSYLPDQQDQDWSEFQPLLDSALNAEPAPWVSNSAAVKKA